MSCRTTSGGSVSTSLAKAYTGLTDKEIQHAFHALKREGEGMPAPSELALAEWRDRQFDLIERASRMSDTRREKLRSHLFRARSEPVPDGATFYAWSRIEARARQEVAIRSITSAVDLDPPGSHAHLYDVGEDGRPKTVWYASYGSNLHRDRMLTYIKGGQPPGSTRVYDGCRDQSIPDEDIPIRFAGARPHFALTSRIWRGGIAFIDARKGESATALGRAYKVSIAQYDDIVAQENGGSAKTSTPVPLDEALATGRSVTGSGPYETILHIGDYQGAPVLTFTAPFSTKDATTRHGHVTRAGVRMPVMTNKPSPAYIRMIGSGLGETFGMDEVAQADYIRGCPGGDRYTRQQLVKILRSEEETPATTGLSSSRFSEKPVSGGSASGSRNPAFVSPFGSERHRIADAQAAADGAVLADLRERGLFPADDSGYRVTKRAVDPARRVSSSRKAPKRSKTSKGRKAGGGSKAPEIDPSRRGLLAGVKTYSCGREQEEGVRRWEYTLKDAKTQATLAESSVRYYQTRVNDTVAPNPRAGELLAQSEAALAHHTAAVAEAQAKLRAARAQQPATYYAPGERRSRAAWQVEDNRVLIKHREAEHKHGQAQSLLAALEARYGDEPTAAQRRELSNARGRVRRAAQKMTGFENRLQEIHERIQTADNAS